MKHFHMCLSLLVLLIALSAFSTEIKLKNGTVYKGTIVKEDKGFFLMAVGKSTIAINKTLIVEKDKIPYANGLTGEKAVANSSAASTSSGPAARGTPEQWKVSLSNGSVFFGKQISENKRVLVLESKGAPVSIFKNMITAIDSGQTISGASPAVAGGTKSTAREEPKSGEIIAAPVSATKQLTTDSKEIAIPSPRAVDKKQKALKKSQPVAAKKEPADSKAPPALPEPVKSSPPAMVPKQQTETVTTVKRPAAGRKFTTQGMKSVGSTSKPQKPATAADKTLAGSAENGNSPSDAAPLPPPRSRVTVVSLNDATSSGDRESSSGADQEESADVADSRITSEVEASQASSLQVYTAPLPSFVQARKKSAPQQSASSNTPPPGPVSKAPATVDTLKKGSEEVPPLRATLPPPSAVKAESTLGEVTTAKARVQEVSQPVALPMAAPAPVKVVKKRTDGKQEILLTNGTRFVGTVQSDGEHSIAFVADGAVITILKRLIKEIDGEPYTYKQPEDKTNAAMASASRANTTRKKQQKTKAQRVLFRLMPVVELPKGITVDSIIDSMSKNSDWRSRSRAARMLGAMGPWGVAAISDAAQLLSDTTQSTFAVPDYIDSVQAEQLLPPAFEAARALAQLGNQGLNELVKSYSSGNADVRRHVVFGLGNCFFDAAAKMVKTALTDSDARIRRIALGSLRIPDALAPLSEACNDRDAQVRTTAVFLLGKTGDTQALPVLRKMVSDKNSQVRTAVAEALTILGSSAELPLLRTLCSDRNNLVRAASLRALGSMDDTNAVDICIAATRDSSVEVRLGALESLATIRNSRSIPSLYSLVKDPNEHVREKAAAALKAHTDISLLIEALSSESKIVKTNVAYILWLMTAQDFGQDKELWEGWAAQNSKPAKTGVVNNNKLPRH